MLRVIKYGASWCHQCKQQDKEFEKNPLHCPLDTVDIDDLKEEEIDSLKLRSIPVTILWEEEDDVWTEIHRWNGFVKSNDIVKFIK